MSKEINPEQVGTKVIICRCGCAVFEGTMVHRLAPGDEKGPTILTGIKAWRCADCGTLHMPENLPKKTDESEPEKKLILPNKGKVIQMQ